jgi:hypothetical protein
MQNSSSTAPPFESSIASAGHLEHTSDCHESTPEVRDSLALSNPQPSLPQSDSPTRPLTRRSNEVFEQPPRVVLADLSNEHVEQHPLSPIDNIAAQVKKFQEWKSSDAKENTKRTSPWEDQQLESKKSKTDEEPPAESIESQYAFMFASCLTQF